MSKSSTIRRPSFGFMMLVGTGLIWGTIGIASKYVFQQSDLDAVSVSWLRAAIASPFCLVMALRAMGRDFFKMPKRDFVILVLLGIALILYQMCYLIGINHIGVSAATLISLCGAPVIVAVASVLFLGEVMTPRFAGALTGAVIGTALIVGWHHGSTGGTRDTLIGVAFSLGSAVGIATHVMVSRSVAGRHHPLRPLAIGFTSGALFFTPVILWRGISLELSGTTWGLVFYLALGPSVIAYWMYQRGLQDEPATEASIVTLLEPLIAAILAAILFDERLGVVGSVGALLLVGSIAVLTLTAPKDPRDVMAPVETVGEAIG